MPDVICDWREVQVVSTGHDQVRVSGARGSSPTTTYKATCVASDGFRVIATAMFSGLDAGGRARKAAEAIIARSERFINDDGFGQLDERSIEVVGAGDVAGSSHDDRVTEVVVKVALRHQNRTALDIFAREFVPMALVAQGMTGLFAGRPTVAPVFNVYHLLIDKADVPLAIDLGDRQIPVAVASGNTTAIERTPQLPDSPASASASVGTLRVPLRQLAWARSGDKGNKANIGVLARRPEFFEVLKRDLTTVRVAAHFSRYLKGPVKRWELKGQHALNFLLDAALGGTGGTSSLRYDPQGKSFAAMLLTLPIEVPAIWEKNGWLAPASGVLQ
jgi:hypothetical protein